MTSPLYTPQANAVPMQRTQVPGYYRKMIGDIEVTALYDGYLSIGTPIYQDFSPISKEALDKLISDEFRPMTEEGGVQTAVSGYLINTGNNLILMDAGTGDVFGDKVGKLAENMKRAGYHPEQVDIILPTHMHFDHFSGVTRNGKMEFPNATIYLAKEETEFWIDTPLEKIPEHIPPEYVQWAQEALAPYQAAGRVEYYRLGDEIVPGMVSVAITGHTPGHGGIEFSSKGETMIVWGDLLHNHALQLHDPNIAAEFDVYAGQMRNSRSQRLAELAKRKIWIAGAHLPFPGIGHIAEIQKGSYRWIPVEYTPLEY